MDATEPAAAATKPAAAPAADAADALQPSTARARSLVRALLTAGVRDVVICPGSRSAPLTYAFAQAAEADVLRTWVRIDERSAGFFALGLARGHRIAGRPQPVAVLTTSGSAAINLHPALVEAAHAHLPLIALTADRPARLRRTGANQTLDDQSRSLPEAAGVCDIPVDCPDPEAAAGMVLAAPEVSRAGVPAAPVQLNVQFDTPLVPTPAELADGWVQRVAEQFGAAGEGEAEAAADVPIRGDAAGEAAEPAGASAEQAALAAACTALREDAAHTIVLAGDGHGFDHADLAAALTACAVPVLAEPSSPLAAAPVAVPLHHRVLTERAELLAPVRTVIVIGKPTLFRPDAALIADPSRRIVRIPAGSEATLAAVLTAQATAVEPSTAEGPEAQLPTAERTTAVETSGVQPSEQVRRWLRAGQDLLTDAADADNGRRLAHIHAIVRAALTAHDGELTELYAASSSAIRYIADVIDSVPVAERVRIHASRGLAGIDGLVSTASGLAHVLGGGSAPVRLLIGDLAMLHDIGGLLREAGEDLPNLTIIVLNDDGGQIFAGLEHGGAHLAPYFQRYFATPHGRDFAALADGYGWPYAAARDASELSTLLAARQPGIIEIRLPDVIHPAAGA